jgi:hypothetical protein
MLSTELSFYLDVNVARRMCQALQEYALGSENDCPMLADNARSIAHCIADQSARTLHSSAWGDKWFVQLELSVLQVRFMNTAFLIQWRSAEYRTFMYSFIGSIS